MLAALDIVEVAGTSRASIDEVATVYYALGDRLQLHWLRDQIGALPRESRWQTLARAALRDELYSLHSVLVGEVLQGGGADVDREGHVDAWQARNSSEFERCVQVLVDIRMGGVSNLETLSVALREVRNLIQSSAHAPPPAPTFPGAAAAEQTEPESVGFA